MEKIFVDTGILIALISEEDQCHERALELFKEVGELYKLAISSYVLDEFITWARCRKKMDVQSIFKFVQGILVGEVEVLDVDEEVFGNSLEIMKKFKDQYYSFTDCTSFAIMLELKIKKVMSTDKHFTIAGFENLVRI